MKAIVKVLLEKGIDEDTIHEILNVLEADLPHFVDDAATKQRKANNDAYIANMKKQEAIKKSNKEKVQAARVNLRKAARGQKYTSADVIE